jgi:phosphoserine phosphatase RsbU/P
MNTAGEDFTLDGSELRFIRHELRTPLNQILGYSEMLREDAVDGGDQPLADDLGKIEKAARNLLSLINVHLAPSPDGQKAPGAPPESAAGMRDEGKKIFAASAAKSRSQEPDSGHILLVDDNESNRDVLTRQLEKQGYSVTAAEDGNRALELLKVEAFDLILLDIIMPGMNGLQVLEHLKEDASLRHIPVIMISALDEIEGVVRCIEIGAEDYLPKPFDPVLLRARIGASLEKKRFHDAEQHYLKTIVETQEALNNELNEAADYVRSLIPAPMEGEITARWCYIPSTQLGGDAFGYHWLDEEHFVIYLLDVCGHGVGAAMLSISVMNLLRSGSLPATDFRKPGEVLRALNERFQMEAHHEKYFTIWYGVYHRKKRTIECACGGHPQAVLLSGTGLEECRAEKVMVHGTPIGWDIESEYKSHTFELPPFARLYVFSDGTYEIVKPDKTMGSYLEFFRLLKDLHGDSSSKVEEILAATRARQGSDAFDDDFSLVELTFH